MLLIAEPLILKIFFNKCVFYGHSRNLIILGTHCYFRTNKYNNKSIFRIPNTQRDLVPSSAELVLWVLRQQQCIVKF